MGIPACVWVTEFTKYELQVHVVESRSDHVSDLSSGQGLHGPAPQNSVWVAHHPKGFMGVELSLDPCSVGRHRGIVSYL